jgi:RimJ/RimL family protein N-acetyltransferase
VPYAVICLQTERAVGIVSYGYRPINGDGGNWSRHLVTENEGYAAGYRGRLAAAKNSLEWKCDSMNLASRRAAERLGFSWEGRLRHKIVRKGRTRDSDILSIINDEWSDRDAVLRRWLAASNFDEQGRQRQPLAAFR